MNKGQRVMVRLSKYTQGRMGLPDSPSSEWPATVLSPLGTVPGGRMVRVQVDSVPGGRGQVEVAAASVRVAE